MNLREPNFNLWFIPVRMEITACVADIKEGMPFLPLEDMVVPTRCR